MGEYYIIITDAGVALEAAAHAAGEPVTLTAFGVCDGGTAFTPDPAQTALANEVYRGDISSLSVSADDASVLEAQCVIPATSGGYTIRGIGLYAGDTLYAVGNYPDQPKPAPDSGYAASLEILAQLAVSDTADVTLNVTDGAWLSKEEGDQLYFRQDKRFSELAEQGADAQSEAREHLALGTAAVADIITSPDDATAGRVLTVGAGGLLGTAPRTATVSGNSYDNIPTALGSGFWTHAISGGPYAHTVSLLQDGGGKKDNRHLIIPSDANGKVALRWDDGTTFRYQYFYTDKNKPAPSDIGAVNKGGDTMSGTLKVVAEVQSTSANSFRIAYGDYGTFWRNDGSSLYLMLTNKGDAYGAYNALRPLRVSLASGAVASETPFSVTNTITASKEITAGYSGSFAWVEQYKTKAPFFNSYSTTGASEYHPVIKQQATIPSKNSWAFSMGSLVSGDALSWHLHLKGSGSQDLNFKWDTNGNFNAPGQIVPGSYANFDNRYYTKTQSDAAYMPKTGAYTKTESDGRYQAKGSYTPTGTAYTKAESDARFLQGWRLGAVATATNGNNDNLFAEAPNGAVVVSVMQKTNYTAVNYRYAQYNLNGTWYNAGVAG